MKPLNVRIADRLNELQIPFPKDEAGKRAISDFLNKKRWLLWHEGETKKTLAVFHSKTNWHWILKQLKIRN